jgi:hypothetical protein
MAASPIMFTSADVNFSSPFPSVALVPGGFHRTAPGLPAGNLHHCCLVVRLGCRNRTGSLAGRILRPNCPYRHLSNPRSWLAPPASSRIWPQMSGPCDGPSSLVAFTRLARLEAVNQKRPRPPAAAHPGYEPLNRLFTNVMSCPAHFTPAVLAGPKEFRASIDCGPRSGLNSSRFSILKLMGRPRNRVRHRELDPSNGNRRRRLPSPGGRKRRSSPGSGFHRVSIPSSAR